MTKKKFFDLAKEANEFPKVDLEKETETKPKGPLKERIYVIDDDSLCYKILIEQHQNDYDMARTRKAKETDTIYDIIKANIEGNKGQIKYFLHYCQKDFEDDPKLYAHIDRIRSEYPEKISIFKAYENHSQKGIESLATKYDIKIPLTKSKGEDSI